MFLVISSIRFPERFTRTRTLLKSIDIHPAALALVRVGKNLEYILLKNFKISSLFPFQTINRLVNSIDTRINSLDVFDLFKYMSEQPLGREIVWDYFRNNYYDIIKQYGEDDPRLGDLLIDITSSFENEFMFYEVNNN